MAEGFKIGDHVGWHSEAGWVSGTVIAIHTQDFDYKGHTHHASQECPVRDQERQDRSCRGSQGQGS